MKLYSRDLAVPLLLLCLGLLFLSSRSLAAEGLTPEELALVKRAEAARTETVQEIYGSVVAIFGNDRAGGGSGFLFDEAGYALTNHHVVAAAGSEGWAGLADGKLYRWQLIGTDPGGDVAIIRLTGQEKFPIARLGLSDTVQVGDWILALGNPFVLAEDLTPTVTLGIVSGVGRYQAGAGKNTLVYGNCIQVDSSVNPGNSGGPAFDMTGRVIGINGRISAMERGRVNVGVGYAISMEQIRNFIPDLLATKVVQHGTLDAQFSTRGGHVVCSAINLDSPIARAGLKLGDRLISFTGVPITDVNVFTNLSTLYPAGWPVQLVFEHAGREEIAYVRLTALPYDIQPVPEQPAEGEKKEGEKKEGEGEKKEGEAKPAEEKPDAEKPAGEQPKESPAPGQPPRVVQAPHGLQITTQGEVRDEKLNRAVSDLLLARAHRAMLNPNEELGKRPDLWPPLMHATAELRQQGKLIGSCRFAIGGREFFVEWEGMLGQGRYRFEQGEFLRSTDPQSREKVDAAEALAQPLVMQVFALSQLWSGSQTGPGPALDSGDVALGRRAYRLLGKQGEQEFHLWLSMFDEHGDSQVRLTKAGLDPDAAPTRPAVTFQDWQPVAEETYLPHRMAVVTGLNEKVQLEVIVKEVKQMRTWDEVEKGAQ